ncbi:unnamed protein product [Phytophthora lilii]|uniref:Unnamed protein product n=1 Tax=Phytophthora lilii TaxID=2077276 RepID=A0A9W7D9I8_9STRA|nr:unnamed protein product [Phytophthora lilii]
MDDEVWSSFDRSVAYMREVAALYESAFGGRAEPRKAVSKAHLDEAHNQAQQALELLASNLLNASMTVINAVEKQVRLGICYARHVAHGVVLSVGERGRQPRAEDGDGATDHSRAPGRAGPASDPQVLRGAQGGHSESVAFGCIGPYCFTAGRPEATTYVF